MRRKQGHVPKLENAGQKINPQALMQASSNTSWETTGGHIKPTQGQDNAVLAG